ncbi:hypothetical protein [Deinococcus soli (ex Cha et al. 2016)]|uniref:Uncharacterized protein n=1 Tax=Deinococcus soli (ex Cha et al. 2016) TaxID=1309411 RepID=A0ACC6KPJ1_9DEIO|nr:hypothetical protein [Deinococcus soli (ex Cha et al. 2016)]MDR6330587.1 hypothetical protein [Deinococcus soli (ex Cha et al. 2016)]MDR6754364.1 hypothetical protein [Deinococcus soli (ex Cha et al. 2016)]
MTSPLPRPARAFLLGAALLVAALGVSGAGRALQICPECLDVQVFDPCLGC